MNQSIFETVEQVLSVPDHVKSASKISEIDCPEDNLENHDDYGHDH